jgi:cyclopropane-fatty-acyl-phospholipid synthase
MERNDHSLALPSPNMEEESTSWSRHSVNVSRRGRVTRIDRWLANLLLRLGGDPPLRLVLWDGSIVNPCQQPAVGALHLRDRATLLRLASQPDFQFGESYVDGGLFIEGDLLAVMDALYRGVYRVRMRGGPLAWLTRLGRPRRRGANALHRSRRNIHHHYDLGNDFYRLWLDQQLLYTCAYFLHEGATLEEAQIAKMDHICRKLQLQPGDEVIEAGCGWGAFALHMARHYGVRVRAYNISTRQIAFARKRAQREGLQDRVEFIRDDYRNISGQCDAFVSVGMLEHVGADNYSRLGAVIDRCLRPQGRGLIHSIGRNRPGPMNTWTDRRIFPGANPPSPAEMTAIFEPYDFSVLDLENLRLHYAITLQHWLARFDDTADQVRDMFDERFVRIWRLYLAGSAAAFSAGQLQLFQVLFNRGQNNAVPLTRQHLYAPRA